MISHPKVTSENKLSKLVHKHSILLMELTMKYLEFKTLFQDVAQLKSINILSNTKQRRTHLHVGVNHIDATYQELQVTEPTNLIVKFRNKSYGNIQCKKIQCKGTMQKSCTSYKCYVIRPEIAKYVIIITKCSSVSFSTSMENTTLTL